MPLNCSAKPLQSYAIRRQLNFFQIEVAALNSLKNFWRNLPPNWAGSDPCGDDWVGIRCTNSRVISIKLGSVGLEGQLSDHISSLTELQILDLSQNPGMTGSVPASIGNLKNLTTLLLDGNELTGPIPLTLGLVQALLVVRLGNNSLSGNVPSNLNNLTNLTDLYLSNNELSGTLPNLTGMSSLQTLDLSNNGFDTSVIPTWVSS
ncbi:hypothetical protein SLEP1_g58724, partial [Rubroshorea leprosula]